MPISDILSPDNGALHHAYIGALPDLHNEKMDDKQLIAELQQLIESEAAPTTADPQTTLQAALAAYQNARIDGLCHEGAWEIALQSLKNPP